MSSAKTSIVYEGEALEDGSMEVHDFAPSILAFADLCQEAYFTLTGEEKALSVRINADFKKGSFETIVEVIQTLGSIRSLIGDTLSAAEFIDLILRRTGGLLYWIKKTKGRPLKSKDKGGEGYLYYKETEYKVGFKVGKLLTSASIRKKTKGFVKPLNIDGVNKIRFKKQDFEIEKHDKDYFNVNMSDDSETQSDDSETHEETLLAEIITPQLDGYRKWRFNSGKDEFFTAFVEDQTFLAKVRNSDISFSSGDVLKIKRRTNRQIADGKITAAHYVIEVLKIISTKQGNLFGQKENGSESDGT